MHARCAGRAIAMCPVHVSSSINGTKFMVGTSDDSSDSDINSNSNSNGNRSRIRS